MPHPNFSFKAMLGLQRAAKRGYIGGFLWALFGDSGDDGMCWEVLAGIFVGASLGWLADRFITPYAFTVIGTLLGPMVGAAIVAVRIADEPRPMRRNDREHSVTQE